MPFLIGVLLDVSSSMKSVFENFEEKDGKQSLSVFSVINDLVGKSVSPGNGVFAIGFGGKNVSTEFDILGSLQNFREKYDKEVDFQMYEKMLQNIYPYIKDVSSIPVDKIKNHVPFYLIKLVSDGFNYSKELRKTYKDTKLTNSELLECLYSFSVGKIPDKFKEIQRVVSQDKNIKELLLQNEIRTFDFTLAIEILRYWLEGKLLNDYRIRGIMGNIEPLIYGRPYLFQTLKKSVGVFSQTKYQNHEKFLLVLSTEGPSNEKNFLEEIEEATKSTRDKKITVVSCYISRSNEKDISQSRTLFGSVKEKWDIGARALFNLSSGISTKLLPHAIFRARNWKIETTNDEIKLFLQINDPDLIQEACNLASEVVGSQDALLDILGNISLAKYIMKTNDEFTAKNQVGGTCYANASAAVLHLAMQRVLKRTGGYPEFEDILKLLIDKYGEHGANTLTVLTDICPSYRLHCQSVKADEAIDAISKGRSLVARYSLTDVEWNIFCDFFKNNPKGILTKNELDIDKRIPGSETEGHAVVLTSFNSDCFRFMNSWGEEWGDLGFCRVKNEKVLGMEFIDVYWSLKDLYPEELEYFKNHGASLAKSLLQRFTDLNDKTYACPKCNSVSKVTEFTGTLSKACCPKCKKRFECSDDIVMNLYLSSILQKP
ncbi:uncharacterized protein LOC127721490 [Mytilus californianus]|uniref:uncharacterized protein LOC127721490 n=1 Tax=Mytilus californianus TaxID=6549 RepID=UPI00224502B5|nr:uncharacterized protein LOC127721490 [Mytilus californianus]XP_052084211.1 uncharacterized protein LOC127721490 [Mytilus californianus]